MKRIILVLVALFVMFGVSAQAKDASPPGMKNFETYTMEKTNKSVWCSSEAKKTQEVFKKSSIEIKKMRRSSAIGKLGIKQLKEMSLGRKENVAVVSYSMGVLERTAQNIFFVM